MPPKRFSAILFGHYTTILLVLPGKVHSEVQVLYHYFGSNIQDAKMKRGYGRVRQLTVKGLKSILGSDGVLTAEGEMEGYSHDEAPLKQRCYPQVVVKPSSAEEVSRLLTFAGEKRIPVTPRGAGTGLSGGCTPIHGGIVLSMERMNRILEIDGDNFVAIVEPGVTLSELHDRVEAEGLSYPVRLGEPAATVGGTVATNAGGINAVRYGVTRNHILGLEAVLADGSLIKTGGAYVKSSTGYDLTQLIIGSEGTLAVVTRIILKLITRPPKRDVLFIPFNGLKEAIDAVPDILRLKAVPAGIEFMERSIIEIVEKDLGRELPYRQGEAFLMITMEGESEDEIHQYFSQVDAVCRRHGAIDAVIPGSQRARRRLIDMRERFYHALKRYAPLQVMDVVVPRRRIAEFVAGVKEISEKRGVPIISYGHAGDGNVHLHPVCKDMSRHEWDRRVGPLMDEIYRAGIAFGGAISGEHGIGFDKKKYLSLQIDQAQLNIMKALKKAFDPENILNPGKIFDL